MKLSKILLSLLLGIFLILTIYFIYIDNYIYAFISLLLFLMASLSLAKYVKITDDPNKAFKKRIKKILKTYDSILVEIETLPKLSDKKIIKASSFRDMVNAEYELRKPIYFFLQEHAIDFILLNKLSAYTFTMNETEEFLSELDIYLAEKRKEEEAAEKEFNTIDSLDETTVIKLDNLKEYIVSPLKKNKKKKEEEYDEPKDYKFFVGFEKILEDLEKQ